MQLDHVIWEFILRFEVVNIGLHHNVDNSSGS